MVTQAKNWTQALLTQKLMLSCYSLLLPRSCCWGLSSYTTPSFFHPTSNYLLNILLCARAVLGMERPYNFLGFLQISPNWFEEKPARSGMICKTIRVVSSCNSCSSRSLFLQGEKSKVKMRLNAPWLLGSTGIVTMFLWNHLKTVSSWS